jgi:hypothetical protein
MPLRIDAHHAQTLNCRALVAHTSGHPHAFPNPPRVCAGADRTGGAQAVALAVRSRAAAKAVTAYNTLEAATLRPTGHVDEIMIIEEIDVDYLTWRVLRYIVCGHLAEMAHPHIVFHLSLDGLRQFTLRYFAEPKLDGFVSVTFFRPDLRDDVRSGLDNRDRNGLAPLREHCRHAKLAPEQSMKSHNAPR